MSTIPRRLGRRAMNRSVASEGFTLIELLVVMLAIGILAAIAIPSFASQRQKAADVEVKQGVAIAARAMETLAVEHAGNDAGRRYFTGYDVDGHVQVDPADLGTVEPSLRDMDGRLFVQTNSDQSGYIVYAFTPDNSSVFAMAKNMDSWGDARLCQPVGKGGCPDNDPGDGYGRW